MNLLVFPGGSDPNDPNYNQVYNLIKDFAPKYGITDVIIPTYLGHSSHNKMGQITIESSARIILDSLKNLEKKKSTYKVICRSYGCFPFTEVIKKYKTNYLKKAVLWGVPPYFLYYKETVEDFNVNLEYALGVGANPSTNLFSQVYPFELSLKKLQNINFDLYICSGEKDEFFPECFRKLLISINKSKNIHFPKRIKNLTHSVKKPNKEYFNLLF